jgi:hypothetical protein
MRSQPRRRGEAKGEAKGEAMSIRSRLDNLERQMKAAQAALAKAGRIRTPMIFINDPEEDLDQYRVHPSVMTIKIGSDVQPDVYPGDGFNDLGISKLWE